MLEKIRDVLSEYVEVSRDEITMETNLTSDLGLSSLDVVDAIVGFEEEFDIEIPDRKFVEIVTVGDLINMLQEEYGLS